jgi:hypothetical protein
MTNPLTTTGDTIYSSSGTTPARLGIGSTGQVLTVAAGLPSWATAPTGGMTLLSTTTLSGASTTISSISQSYTNLQIFIFGVTNTVGNVVFRCAPNASTTSTDQICTSSATAISSLLATYLYPPCSNGSPGEALFTDATNAYSITIDNYSSTTARKNFSVFGGFLNSSSSRRAVLSSGLINTTSAISSLVFDLSANAFNAGTVLIYGVK